MYLQATKFIFFLEIKFLLDQPNKTINRVKFQNLNQLFCQLKKIMKFLVIFLILFSLNQITLSLDCHDMFMTRMLELHNQLRPNHGASELALSTELAEIAQGYAEYLAATNTYEPSSYTKYGENLAYMSNSNLYSCEDLANQIAKMWYNEITLYDFNKPGFTKNTAHFTQMVWKNTQEIGCGIAFNRDKTYCVCNYYPPGNIMEAFGDNV